MNRIDELNKLPEPVKKELLEYADILMARYESRLKGKSGRKWADVSKRGISRGESASDTVIRLRGEEKW